METKDSDGRIDTFANRLQKAMDVRGVKNAELSRLTGISQQRVGQYVFGRYEAKQSALYVIAHALKVNPAWLMGYDLPMTPPAVKKNKRRGQEVADEVLKRALFGSSDVSDALLEDVKNMARVHFELSKMKKLKSKRNTR